MRHLENKDNNFPCLIIYNEQTQQIKFLHLKYYSNTHICFTHPTKIASWKVADDLTVDLHFIDGAIRAEVLQIKNEKITRQEINNYFIEGIPNEVLHNPDYLRLYLMDSHARLTKLSDHNYKLCVNLRVNGGGWGHWVLIGVGLLLLGGGLLVVAGIAEAGAGAAALAGGANTAATVMGIGAGKVAAAGTAACVASAGCGVKAVYDFAYQRGEQHGAQQVEQKYKAELKQADARNAAQAEMLRQQQNQNAAQDQHLQQAFGQRAIDAQELAELQRKADELERAKIKAQVNSPHAQPQPSPATAAQREAKVIEAKASANNSNAAAANDAKNPAIELEGLRHRKTTPNNTESTSVNVGIFSAHGKSNAPAQQSEKDKHPKTKDKTVTVEDDTDSDDEYKKRRRPSQ